MLQRLTAFISLFIITAGFLYAEERISPWPWMEKELVLSLPLGPDNPRNSEGDFVTLDNGDILYVYSHFYGDSREDYATAYLASRVSSDKGKTWSSEDKLELENEGGMNVMSVTLRKLADGRIALFYETTNSYSECRPYIRFLQEDGTWGERIETIPDATYNILNNDRVIQLPSGRILLPIALHPGCTENHFNPSAELFCMISDDGGATWYKGGEVAPIEKIIYQEPGLCELADGRLLMNIRTNGGAQYYAYSEDDGLTWGPAFKSCLDSPMSPTLIKRIPGSDDLLAVGNPMIEELPGGWGREAMTIERLTPDGQTVLVRKTLDYPVKDVIAWQYPAIHFVGDGTFLVAYFSWTEGIHIYRMNLADLDK